MRSGNFEANIIHDIFLANESFQGIVEIPFNSNYTIRLQNHGELDALAYIYIDGENISENGFIIKAKTTSDIERSVSSKKKFLFVSSKSEKAKRAGKDRQPDDRNGVVEIKWRPSKPAPQIQKEYIPYTPYFPYWPSPYYIRPYKEYWYEPYYNNNNITYTSTQNSNSRHVMTITREGCTVDGGQSNQDFTYSSIYNLVPESEAIVMKIILKGFHQQKKDYCSNCGERTVGKYCSNCGEKV